MNWHYEESNPNGGAPGDAYKSSFNGAGKNAAAILAREAIQNSVDAANDPEGAVRVRFRFASLDGQERKAFEAAAHIDEMRSREPRLGLIKNNMLKKRGGAAQLLYVEDYETTGLRGNPTKPSSNLRKLLMDLGGSDKVHSESETGGSYGFGKAVYSGNSRIGTIFAFSRTVDDGGEPLAVFMGCAYHTGHDYDGETYTGRAWLGVPHDTGRGKRLDPFVGAEAELFAQKLGFDRDEGDIGTSILLLDTDVDVQDLVQGIEDWWWPRIMSKMLDVEVVDIAGDEHFPRPQKRRHLKPFIEAFSCALGSSPDIPARQRERTFKRIDGLKPGTLGTVVLDDSEEENPLGEDYEERLDTVALVRKPLMVVDYHQKWRPSPSAPKAVGCFLADSDIDRILKLAEPPAHDKWDPDAQRLPVADEDYPAVVRSVLKRIKANFKDFQNWAKPPAPPRPRRLAQLERDLASWFGVGPKGKKAPPGANPAPVSLRPDGPHLALEDGMLRASGHVDVAMAGDDQDDVSFRIRLTLQVAEEDGVSGKDPIPLMVETDERCQRLVDQDCWVGVATKQGGCRLTFRSAPYDPSWTVRFVPEVLSLESNATSEASEVA